MVRIILITSLTLLVGCSTMEPRVKTEIVTQQVPVLYCPAPPEYTRPVLPISTPLTPEQLSDPVKKADTIAKQYKATVKVLQGYSKQLELIIRQYDVVNKSYDELRQKFKQNWEDPATQSSTHD